MMDFSLLSTSQSSVVFHGDKSQSFPQTYELDSAFSEYSNIIEYPNNSKIIEICNEFRRVTKKCSEDSTYLLMIHEYLLNLTRYLDVVVKNISLLSKNTEGDLYTTGVLINDEIKTWKLIYQLYESRTTTEDIENPRSVARSSEVELIKDLYKNHTQLREAQIVLDWLELSLREKVEKNMTFLIGAQGKTWEHTKHNIRRHGKFKVMSDKLLNELDPDAPLRGHLTLTDNDKNDENEYLRYLFYCLQSGDWEKAQILCQSHDELWRALSLAGWKPFHNISIKDGFLNNNDVIGNPNRNVFKSVCWQLSEDSTLNIYERAIYAIFCGNINVLCLVEKDWEGLLWAHFKVFIENVVDDCLRMFTINGSYGTQSLFGDDDFDWLTTLGLGNCRFNSEELTHWTREQIFDDIASKLSRRPIDIIKSASFIGSSKPQISFYQSIFEMVQQFVIVDDVEGLLYYIELCLSKLPSKKMTPDKLILRFLAHVIIFVFSIHVDMKIDTYHRVLEHYIECLIEENSLENVSFYVSKLSTDLQVQWYCKCMAGVTEYTDKRKCIFDAIDYDLPIVEISRLVVKTIRMKPEISEVVQSTLYHGSLNNTFEQPVNIGFINDSDQWKISGLDWLTFIPEQHCHLIRQANALCRLFLDNDKLLAAKMVLGKVTMKIIGQLQQESDEDGGAIFGQPQWLTSALYENKCYKAFIVAYDTFGDWFNHFSSQKPIEKDFSIKQDLNRLSFQEKQKLQKDYEDFTLSVQQWEKIAQFNANKVIDLFIKALKMGKNGWLSEIGEETSWSEKSSTDNDDNDCWTRRREQIGRLQRKGVANMSFMLMKVLKSSERNERCFELVNLLADEKLRLWQFFEKGQLQRLLQMIRQCSMHLLSDGFDPIGLQA